MAPCVRARQWYVCHTLYTPPPLSYTSDTPQVLTHLVPYLLDPHNYRRPAISGPWLNALSDAWLAHAAAQGNRSERVHELHKKYGKFVRIAPNHISIADPDALQVSRGDLVLSRGMGS